MRWRVGRRRLAWRPGVSALHLLELAEGPLMLVVGIPAILWWLGTWVLALLATVVVWPTRAVTDRWPVVAYQLDAKGDENAVCRSVHGRSAADALVREWAQAIERHGRP